MMPRLVMFRLARSRRPATTEPEVFTPASILITPVLADAGPEEEELEPETEAETGPLRRCIVTRERRAKEKMIRFVLGPDRTVVPDLAARLPGRGIWLSARGDVLETARAQGSLVRAFAKQASKEVAKDAKASAPDDAGPTDSGPKDAGKGSARASARAGRGSVTLPPDLNDRIEAMLVRRIVELLGLARRAGQAVCGFQKAREWLTSNRAGLVLQASDGSVDERARFLSGVKALDLSVDGNVDETGAGDAVPDDRMPTERVSQEIPVGAPLSAAAMGAVFGRDHVVHVVVAPGRLAEALTNEIARLSGLTSRTGPGRPSAKAELGMPSAKAELDMKAAKAGPNAAGGNAGTIEAGETGQDDDLNKRAGV